MRDPAEQTLLLSDCPNRPEEVAVGACELGGGPTGRRSPWWRVTPLCTG